MENQTTGRSLRELDAARRTREYFGSLEDVKNGEAKMSLKNEEQEILDGDLIS